MMHECINQNSISVHNSPYIRCVSSGDQDNRGVHRLYFSDLQLRYHNPGQLLRKQDSIE